MSRINSGLGGNQRRGLRSAQSAFRVLIAAACLCGVLACPVLAQSDGARRAMDSSQSSPGTPHRTRLIMKDGSYQLVMSYQVQGSVVSYVSAERGTTEQVPYDLVDWDATHKWEQRHPAPDENGNVPAPPIDPELLKEEADRAALTPEVAPNLSLPEQDSVLALDYFDGNPELVPLVQSDGELNRVTGHSILKLAVNPRSASHEIVQLKGIESPVQMHVDEPVIYMRLGDDSGVEHGGTPLIVDTHGLGSMKDSGPGDSSNSRYVIVRADVRTDARVLASFNISGVTGRVETQEDVTPTKTQVLPGGHWMKIIPAKPLDFGEYALMEVLTDREVNLGVWDFGVHPMAPENRDVIKPQPKRPFALERRRPE